MFHVEHCRNRVKLGGFGFVLPPFVSFAGCCGQWGATTRIITDKLRSYGAAKRIVMPGVAHRQHRY